jgi:hypothetical protein
MAIWFFREIQCGLNLFGPGDELHGRDSKSTAAPPKTTTTPPAVLRLGVGHLAHRHNHRQRGDFPQYPA